MERNTSWNINPDLAKERENCPFDLEEVTNLLDGGKEETENRRRFRTFLFEKIKVRIKILLIYNLKLIKFR